MNTQKPEARSKGDGWSLDFHSMFFTLQGEGPFSGHRSIFIRLAGCNLQCPGCDTEYTEGRALLGVANIIDNVDKLCSEHFAHRCLIVITGGEPLRQPIGELVYHLCALGHLVQIESNGVFAPDDTLTKILDGKIFTGRVKLIVSPKTNRIHDECARLATAFKYVLDHRSVSDVDGLPIQALSHKAAGGVARPPIGRNVPIYVNPFDAGDAEENKKNLAAVAQTCLKFGYIAGVQLHKLLDLA